MLPILEVDGQQQNRDPFGHANNVMHEIVDRVPGIEPVTVNDIALFNNFFAKERAAGRETHGNGMSYMLQMMNRIGEDGTPKLGYKYHDGSNLLPIVTYPLKSSPGMLGIYFLRPMGQEVVGTVTDLSEQLRAQGFDQPIFVKKIFEHQALGLYEQGFDHIETYPWHPAAIREDDTYPELKFDPTSIRDFAPSNRNLNNTFRAVMKLREANEVVETEDDFDVQAWRITQEFFANIHMTRAGKLNLSDPYDYYNMIFHNPSREGLTRRLITLNGEAVAYYIMEQAPGSDFNNFYASIALRHKHKYLGDYSTVSALQSNPNVSVNMGGSEDAGIFEYKRKFGPYSSQQMHWVVKRD